MFMCTRLVVLLLSVLMLSTAYAGTHQSVVFGVRRDRSDDDGRFMPDKPAYSAEVGVLFGLKESSTGIWRGGLSYVLRPITVEDISGDDVDLDYQYLDLPLEYLFKMPASTWVIAGVRYGYLLKGTCQGKATTTCENSPKGPTEHMFYWRLGGRYDLADKLGLEFAYERGVDQYANFTYTDYDEAAIYMPKLKHPWAFVISVTFDWKEKNND